MTATPKALLKALTHRDGHRSAWTGDDVDTLVPQHRYGGQGGRKGKQRLSVVVWLESEINGLIESSSEWQAEAIRRGVKISGFTKDPQTVPILHAVHGLCLLGDGGSVKPVGE